MAGGDARRTDMDTSKLDCYDRPVKSEREQERDENIGWILAFITVAALILIIYYLL